jgi:hypothetical protein
MWEFKDPAKIGLVGKTGFCQLQTIKTWRDGSGGPVHQLALCADSTMNYRTSKSEDAWNNWESIVSTTNGRIAGKAWKGVLDNGIMENMGTTTDLKQCLTKCDSRHGGRLIGISRKIDGSQCHCHDHAATSSRNHNDWEAQYIH